MPFLASLSADAGPPSIYTQYPEIYKPWSTMSEALMNGPSPLSQGERELILAYACAVAGCELVHIAHSEVAYAWGIPQGVVEQLLEAIGAGANASSFEEGLAQARAVHDATIDSPESKAARNAFLQGSKEPR